MGEGMAEQKGWLLLTNDDGIEAEGFRLLVKALHEAGYPLVVFAPSSNHSATGMRINLMTPMNLRSREDLASTWSLDVHQTPAHLFELDGTPCDTMIVALDGGLEHLVPGVRPQLVVSGVNLGPNLSQDAYHSGTMGAAREAGLYGVPAIAASFTSFDPEGMEAAVLATLEVVARATKVLPVVANNMGRPKASKTRVTSAPGQHPTTMTDGWRIPSNTCFGRSKTVISCSTSTHRKSGTVDGKRPDWVCAGTATPSTLEKQRPTQPPPSPSALPALTTRPLSKAIAMRLRKALQASVVWRYGRRAILLPSTRTCSHTDWLKRTTAGLVGSAKIDWNTLIQQEMDNADGHMALQPRFTK